MKKFSACLSIIIPDAMILILKKGRLYRYTVTLYCFSFFFNVNRSTGLKNNPGGTDI
jgi:hypothetical protein